MNGLPCARACRFLCAGLCLALAGGCGALLPTATPHPSLYSLDSVRIEARTATRAPAAFSAAAPTLIVNPPHAAAGFDSQRIIYVREANRREHFAHNEWIDTPTRMLAPLIVAALESGGSFRAVVLTPSAAAGDLRLDTEIIRLQHEFRSQPSRVRFTLRAYIVDSATRRVLATQEFDAAIAAESDDPYGGVVAANRAVQAVLEQLASFCSTAAGNWRPPAAEVPKRAAGGLPGR